MAYDLVILDSAKNDYESIVRYLLINLKSPQAASNFADEFEKQVALACESPESHALSRMSELAHMGYRPLLVFNYVVLYFFRDKRVVVAHIFHQTQDYAKLV